MREIKQKRIMGIIVDVLFFGLISHCIGFILSFLNVPMRSQIITMSFYFFIACKDCYAGISLGKRIFKLQIIDNKTLKSASPFKCVIRNYFLFIWIVELVLMLYNPQGRRFGDFLTNTRVVSFDGQQSSVNMKEIIFVIGSVLVLSVILLLIVRSRFSI